MLTKAILKLVQTTVAKTIKTVSNIVKVAKVNNLKDTSVFTNIYCRDEGEIEEEHSVLTKNMQFLHQILHLKRPNIKMLDLMIYMILNCFCSCPVLSVSVSVQLLPE